MRSNLCSVLVGLLLLGIFGLAGCGSDDNNSNNTVPKNNTYLPVTVGSTWKYTNNSDGSVRTETITANTNNRVTREVITATGKTIATEILSNRASYLSKREIYDVPGNMISTKSYSPEPGMLFLPSSTTAGAHETQTVQINTLPANTDSSLSQDITVVGFETITVPAGTFSNALKIQTIIASREYLSWFALNVGIIRQDIDNVKAFELTSFSVK